jgi:hypothetical protein
MDIKSFEELDREYTDTNECDRRRDVLDAMWKRARTRSEWKRMFSILTDIELFPLSSPAVQISGTNMCFAPE